MWKQHDIWWKDHILGELLTRALWSKYQGQISVPQFFPGLSADNAGSNTKIGGDGLWWQEVWKDKDSGDTEHIKTQIRLAPLWLTFTKCPFMYVLEDTCLCI